MLININQLIYNQGDPLFVSGASLTLKQLLTASAMPQDATALKIANAVGQVSLAVDELTSLTNGAGLAYVPATLDQVNQMLAGGTPEVAAAPTVVPTVPAATAQAGQ
jgi:hypothetical protein